MEHVTPVLGIDDYQAAVDFYVTGLGFEIMFEHRHQPGTSTNANGLGQHRNAIDRPLSQRVAILSGEYSRRREHAEQVKVPLTHGAESIGLTIAPAPKAPLPPITAKSTRVLIKGN